MDRPCYEKVFAGSDEPEYLLKKAIGWLKLHNGIFVKEIIYLPGEMNNLTIFYEGFPDTDLHMMEYWEQETGKRHPNRK